MCARRIALWRVRDAKGRDSGAAVVRACSQRRAPRFSAFRRACVRPVCLRCLARGKVARLRLENLVHAWCGRQATSKQRLRCREPQGDRLCRLMRSPLRSIRGLAVRVAGTRHAYILVVVLDLREERLRPRRAGAVDGAAELRGCGRHAGTPRAPAAGQTWRAPACGAAHGRL